MKRIATILAPQDLDTAGTKVMDININDTISKISMFWKCTNVTVSVMLDAVTACLSKIELVDGSEVLASISGAELQAINFYDSKIMPHHEISLLVGGFFECGVSLDFGRFLWDPRFAFVPTRFKNPQLKVTWDEDACNTSVVVNEFAAYAHCFGEPSPSPTAMLVNREIQQYAMAASSHKYPDLPTDRVLRKVILRGYSTDHDPIALFNTIKLSVDNDKDVPFELPAAQLDKILANTYPRINEFYTVDSNVTIKEIFSALSKDQQITTAYDDTAITAAGEFGVATWTGAKCTTTEGVATLALNAEVSGRMPGNCFPLDFGVPGDPDTWLQAQNIGSLILDLLSSSDADSGDTTFVVAQQVRPY